MAIQTIRKNGVPVAFQAQVRPRGAKSACATFKTYESAREFEEATKKQIMSERSIEENRRTYARGMKPIGVAALAAMRVAQVADEFGAANPDHCYTRYVRRIKGLVGDARVADLTDAWTKAFCERMRKQKAYRKATPMAEATIGQHIGMIRRYCNWKAESLGVVKPRLGLTTKWLEPGWDDGRERRLRGDEESRIMFELGMVGAKLLTGKGHEPGARGKPWKSARHYQLLFDFAIETCARQMEMVRLPWSEVDMDRRVWALPAKRSKTKRKRKIYLTPRAMEILRELKLDKDPGSPLVFHRLSQRTATVSQTFAKAVQRAGVDDFVFHDLRHEGVSRHRLAKTFEPEVLMKMVGHTSAKMTMRYFNPKDEEVHARMEAAILREHIDGPIPREMMAAIEAVVVRQAERMIALRDEVPAHMQAASESLVRRLAIELQGLSGPATPKRAPLRL